MLLIFWVIKCHKSVLDPPSWLGNPSLLFFRWTHRISLWFKSSSIDGWITIFVTLKELIIWWVKSKMSLENPIFQRSIIGFMVNQTSRRKASRPPSARSRKLHLLSEGRFHHLKIVKTADIYDIYDEWYTMYYDECHTVSSNNGSTMMNPLLSMGVSINGVPRVIIHFRLRFSITNQPFWGSLIFGNPHMMLYGYNFKIVIRWYDMVIKWLYDGMISHKGVRWLKFWDG